MVWLNGLAKWLSVLLRAKWLWVRILLQSIKFHVLNLLFFAIATGKKSAKTSEPAADEGEASRRGRRGRARDSDDE